MPKTITAARLSIFCLLGRPLCLVNPVKIIPATGGNNSGGANNR